MFTELAKRLTGSASILQEMFQSPTQLDANVSAISEKLKTLEEEGDAVYHEAMGKLFAEGSEAIDVIKWKDLYDKLEDALDQCEDVGNVLHSIALKNA